MLAYVFWHRPRRPVGAGAAYEHAHIAFHRSLVRNPPVGLRGNAAFTLPEIPWLATARPVADPAGAPPPGPPAGPGYEDWYLLADFTALGVLNEAAVGRGHRTSHDAVARRCGPSAGGLYALIEGQPPALPAAAADAARATWISRSAGSAAPATGDLLGDGIDPRCTSLWRRQLVLGPAPEFCLLGGEDAAGAAPGRLPAGWSARAMRRRALTLD